MRGEPPERLVELVERLHLASAAEVRAMRPRVRRLAGELPDFELVWVDALAQARIITPFQAAQINAGRGESLACGAYVMVRPLPSPYYAACFAARHVETNRVVRLYLARHSQIPAATAARAASELAVQLATLQAANVCVVDEAGHQREQVWATCPPVEGTMAADWMAENGRFPPGVVLHIAREMVARLAMLERFSQPHGDICAAGLILQQSGHVVLPMPGLRGIVRPSEGYSFNDLSPEAYDYLAPERIAEGVPPTLAADVYACGCLWWHLLTGRAPFGGGNSLTKLKAVHAARLVDVRQLAPDVPDALAGAIERSVAREPAARVRSMTELASLLGPASRGGATALVRCLAHEGRLGSRSRRHSRPPRVILRAAIGATVVASLLVIVALQWNGRGVGPRHLPRSVAASTARQRASPSTRTAVIESATGSSAKRHDPAIALASAVEPADSAPVKDLVLSPNDGWHLDAGALVAGQRVRGPTGTRPRVSVPREGLVVECDDVCFENIDFVWDASAIDSGSQDRTAAMIVIVGQSAEWRGCSLTSTGEAPPAAIRWTGPAERGPGSGGELTLRDCVASGVACVVDCASAGSLSVALNNALCVAAGPIVRLHGAPPSDERVTISLDHTTTRAQTFVLEWRYGRLDNAPGPIAISVIGSALDTNPGGGLLEFVGAQRPDRLLRGVTWTGEGSLVTPQAAMALWHGRGNKREVLAEDAFEIAGLVRSRLEFAGDAHGPPSASRVVRWQAPLRSPEPPGIDSNSLYLPRN